VLLILGLGLVNITVKHVALTDSRTLPTEMIFKISILPVNFLRMGVLPAPSAVVYIIGRKFCNKEIFCEAKI